MGPGQSIDLKVTGTHGIPNSGVGAVVVNLTGTEPTTPTFITAYPTGQTPPDTSNLNLPNPGSTDANLVVATVGRDGHISLRNALGHAHIIVDVAGWFPGAPAGPPPGPVDKISGTVYVANPQPPTVTPGLFGVDPESRQRTDDLYYVDLTGVTNGPDTAYYFSIHQQRREFYALEERIDGGTRSLVLTIRSLDNPTIRGPR